MNKQPLVSIILPTYNRASMLGKTIESVITQTYEHWELLVVDDGSTDHTRNEVLRWCTMDGRIKYLDPGKNQGASAARNYGIDRAQGSLITFIDSDDQYDPAKVAKQVEKFRESDVTVGVVTCGRKDFNHEGKLYNEWAPSQKGDVRKNMLRDQRIGAGTPFLMVTREAIGDVVRFDTAINVVEDFDFVMQILQRGYILDFVPLPLVNVFHYQNIERNFSYERAFDAREYLYKKYSDEIKTDPGLRANFIFKTMIFYSQFEKSKPEAQSLSEFRQQQPLLMRLLLFSKQLNPGVLKNVTLKLAKLFYNFG